MTAIITSSGPSPAILSSQILGTSTDESEQAKPSYTFSFTPFLLKTYRHGISPTQPVCKAYMQGLCPLGNACPDRHIAPNRRGGFSGGFNRFGDEVSDMGGNLVCKHWLRGLCKKGEGCEFLHEYNLRRMPECTTFARSGYCPNGDECLYLHIDSYIKESLTPCPQYARGFCPLGPSCSKSHRQKTMCPFYLVGFCPQGITHPAPPLPNGISNSRDKVFEGCGGCEYGVHAKWSNDSDLPPPRRKVVRTKEEIEEERERKREEAEEKEGGDGGGGFRGRGGFFGGGFRGRGRGGGGFDGGGGGGFRGRGRGRY